MTEEKTAIKNYDESLVTDNLKLINHAIIKLNCKWKTDDEYQEYYDYGLIGLIKGAKTYNSEKGKASTYLYTCICNMILRCFYLNSTNKKKVNSIYNISLNETISLEDDTELIDFIQDESVNIEQEISDKFMYEAILNELNKLDETDQICVKMYYGIDGYQKTSLEKIGNKFGFSKERARQRVYRAIEKIREKKINLKEII